MREVLRVLGIVFVLGITVNTQSLAHGNGTRTNLKALDDHAIVTSFVYCNGRYEIATKTGIVYNLEEMHVRMKTDSTDHGPYAGQPIVQVNSSKERITVYFSSLEELINFTNPNCGFE